MSAVDDMQKTVEDLVQDDKGILAADESTPTITRRFQANEIESTEETRRAYREMLLTTPELGDFISGVILYEETLRQSTADGIPLPEVARRQGIVPGIKVDKGLVALAGTQGEKITQGLDGLAERLKQYKEFGARFAKWRDVYTITAGTPSPLAIAANAEVLARYAAVCQALGVVPIVEPEVLIDGDHSIERCAEVSQAVLHEVFNALHRHRIDFELMLLKPSMVLSGKGYQPRSKAPEVADMTVTILKRTVPAAVPGIFFLSGGQSPEEATANLSAMNAIYASVPWVLGFSFARALQEPAMAIWRGRAENAADAQHALYKRARLASAARRGEYSETMEKAS